MRLCVRPSPAAISETDTPAFRKRTIRISRSARFRRAARLAEIDWSRRAVGETGSTEAEVMEQT
jgi:hypothetical protein